MYTGAFGHLRLSILMRLSSGQQDKRSNIFFKEGGILFISHLDAYWNKAIIAGWSSAAFLKAWVGSSIVRMIEPQARSRHPGWPWCCHSSQVLLIFIGETNFHLFLATWFCLFVCFMSFTGHFNPNWNLCPF